MDTGDDRQEAAANGLIAEARRSPEAFVQLYRRHYDAVFRYCAHRLFDRHTAEDLTSDVFLSVVQHLRRFAGKDEQQFRNWLYRIATNAVNGHLRKTARRQGLFRRFARQMHSEGVDPVEPTDGKIADLKEAILALRPRYQTIITLRFFEDLKVTEIAEVLGCTPGTARSQLSRATERLRRRLVAAAVIDETGGAQNE
ncbi:MAG: sigma-70 family RNA polymerase sigma factor [Phycisphaerales bacterium]|nr:MAG: sigma-70 family RNA polymerase sigma factor [Phycisphaerales bacterium]